MLELTALSAILLQYGYLGVFAGVILGGEILLMAAGFLASQHFFSVYLVILLATIAVVLVDIVWYIVGRTGSKRLFVRLEKILVGKKESTEGLDKLLRKHAGKTILIVRFIYGVRAMVLILAGALKMNFWKFILYNFIGSIIWSTVMTLLGYFFGESFDVLKNYIKNGLILGTLVFIIAALALVVVIIIKRRLFKAVKEESKQTKK